MLKLKTLKDTEEDKSGCPKMEGLMKKKNSQGVWKDRYAMLNNAYFLTYKPKGKKPSTELKESVHLKDLEDVGLKGDVLTLSLKNGETMHFQGSGLKDWKHAISVRADWAADQYQKSLESTNARGVHISGWLMKKSHNKYQGFQDRWVKVQGTILSYYKREQDTESLGSADLMTITSIRPYDDTDQCRIFEVQDSERTFIFQASSPKDMLHWINTLEQVRSAALTAEQEKEKLKVINETPVRIRCYDELGEKEFLQNIMLDLNEVYPEDTSEMSIRTHVECAKQLSQYLKDLVPEVQKTPQRPARFDVLALVMTAINNVISERFFSFLPSPTQCEDGGVGAVGEGVVTSELLENASLGDLHAMIDWMTRYQQSLKKIRCPVHNPKDPANPAVNRVSTTHLAPKACVVLETLPVLCRLYVYGGSVGSKGGAAHHLYDHCIKVWDNVIRQPEEMLQRRNDGSFYTNVPVDMWEAINQHISLATSTSSPILHVMIADKVVMVMNDVFNKIIDYVNTLDTKDRPELKEVELEYVSALANDTALHIEEVINLIDNFTIAEIRERIDEIFDPLTSNLVNCGQACLKRLSKLVMSDVQGQVDAVFTMDWLDGDQMHVAVATISDYMNDFEEYLVGFWADKFVYILLEDLTLTYVRSVVFNKGPVAAPPPAPPASPSPSSPSMGFMSSFFQKTKQITTNIIAAPLTGNSPIPIDAESIGRLAQDVNVLNAFFSKKAPQETTSDFLELMQDVNLMLFLDLEGLIRHIAARMSNYPSAAQQIFDTGIAVMKRRGREFTKSDIDILITNVSPVLEASAAEARDKEARGEAEGRLGLLYLDLPPLTQSSTTKITLAHRLKMMSHIPLFGSGGNGAKGDGEDGEGEEDEDAGRESEGGGLGRTDSQDGIEASPDLLSEVMGVLEEKERQEAAEREARERALEEEMSGQAGNKGAVLSYQGYLEKKSPAHNLWQRRFFKLATQRIAASDEDGGDAYTYSLLWYKKEGGAVIKSLGGDRIESVYISYCPRNLVFIPPPESKGGVYLQSELGAMNGVRLIPVYALEEEGGEAGGKGVVGSENIVFTVVQGGGDKDGKEIILRNTKVDRVLKWINVIAKACDLSYDPVSRTWTRAATERYLRGEVWGDSAASKVRGVSVDALIQGVREKERESMENRTRGSSGANSSHTDVDRNSGSAAESKEEKLKKERENIKKRLQEEEQREVAAANPIRAKKTTPPAPVAEDVSTTNPLLRMRSNKSESANAEGGEKRDAPAVASTNGNTTSPVPDVPPPPPTHSPSPANPSPKLSTDPTTQAAGASTDTPPAHAQTTPSRSSAHKKSPAMKRALKKKASASAANVGGTKGEEGEGEVDGEDSIRPSEVDEGNSESPSVSLPSSPSIASVHTRAASEVDSERETVDLSRRAPYPSLTLSPIHNNADLDRGSDASRANSSASVPPMSSASSSPRESNNKRVSFASDVKGSGEKGLSQMELESVDDNQKKTDKGLCGNCTVC